MTARPFLLAAVALGALSAGANAQAPAPRDPVQDSPFVAMLRKADASHVGSVSRADVEAPLKAVQDDQADRLKAQWRSTALFLRLPTGEINATLKQVVDATLAALGEADADKDGKVTAAELQAYAAKEPDPARRAALLERLKAPDANGDGTIDAAERKIELSSEQAAEDVGEARVFAMIEGTRMWQKRSIDSLFEKYAGADGRIRIDDIVERLRKAAEGKEPAKQ